MATNRLDDVEVEVLVAGTWWPGWLDRDYWRKASGGRWEAFVRWTRTGGEQHMDWFDEDQIRRV